MMKNSQANKDTKMNGKTDREEKKWSEWQTRRKGKKTDNVKVNKMMDRRQTGKSIYVLQQKSGKDKTKALFPRGKKCTLS